MPPPRLRKIRKRIVVAPSSRILRSHARLAKSAGLAAALAFDPRFKIEMYSLFLIKILKKCTLSPGHFIFLNPGFGQIRGVSYYGYKTTTCVHVNSMFDSSTLMNK